MSTNPGIDALGRLITRLQTDNDHLRQQRDQLHLANNAELSRRREAERDLQYARGLLRRVRPHLMTREVSGIRRALHNEIGELLGDDS